MERKEVLDLIRNLEPPTESSLLGVELQAFLPLFLRPNLILRLKSFFWRKLHISWQKFASQEEVAAMSLTPVSTPANSPPATPEAVVP